MNCVVRESLFSETFSRRNLSGTDKIKKIHFAASIKWDMEIYRCIRHNNSFYERIELLVYD